MRLTKTEKAYYRNLIRQYMVAHPGCAEVELDTALDWAHGNNNLQMSPQQIREFHRQRASESLRSDTSRDASGRKVRCWHCLRIQDVQAVEEDTEGVPVQRYLWAPTEQATRTFMRDSLLQRVEQVQCDINAIKADLDNCNAHLITLGQPPIQMDLNFSPV